MKTIREVELSITYEVVAYDSGGYGDNRSKDFTNIEEAITYAKTLDYPFSPVVVERTAMKPIPSKIVWDCRPKGATPP